MIKIQLDGRTLDTYAKEAVDLEWTGFRFQKGLRAGYTNDFKIPKTENNLSILRAVGLLDSQTQMFGDKTHKGILQVELRIIPICIQVASVDKNDIGICLYEDVFPEYMKDRSMREYFIDTPSTIIQWHADSVSLYPSLFKFYNYGMPYDTNYAQYHPITKLNDLISAMNTTSGYNMPMVNPDWYAMSTLKNVCPQNQTQMIEGILDTQSHDYFMSGGAHITNDLDINYGDGQQSIVFNRSANVNLKITIAWKAKNNSYNVPFVINYNYNGTNITNEIRLRGDLYGSKVDSTTINLNVNDGGKLTFALVSAEYYDSSSFIAEMTITNYNITEDDYGNELSYIARRPRLIYYDYNSDRYIPAYWDGTTYYYSYKERGVGGSQHGSIITESKSLSYFGIYCNLPDANICDFWYSMQWLMGQKLDFDHQRTVVWKPIDSSAVIEGEITEIRPKSDKLGQNNYIKYQEDDDPYLVSTIDNQWLALNMNLHESKFTRVKNVSQYSGQLDQYSNPEHEADSSEYKCDFNEIDYLTLWWNVTSQGSLIVQSDYIRDIPFTTLGMDALTQSVEVDITTFTPQLRDKDIIYIDGRKFFVVTCKTNIDTQRSELTCLLIPKIAGYKAKAKNNQIR